MPWSEKVFYRSKSRRSGHEGIFLGIENESEIAVVGTPHGIVFFEKHSQSSKKRILETVCCSTASEEHRGNCNLELKEES